MIFESVSDFDIRISDFYQDILLILSTIILLRYIRDTTLSRLPGCMRSNLFLSFNKVINGNVREIRNAIEYAFVLCQNELIDIDHLPPKIAKRGIKRHPKTNMAPEENRTQVATLKALREANGNQSEAARTLGVSRVTAWKRIKKYGIDLKTL